MQFSKALFIHSILCLVFASSSAFALMLGLRTEKLTRDADLIITGDVEDTESNWTPDKKLIMTTAVVSIAEVIKGKTVEKKIRVLYPGGEVGDIGMKISDEAPLRKGEQVLLFLKPEKQFSNGFSYRISGRAQGKYIIGDDLVARKHGFSVADSDELVDNNIQVETLIEKIRIYVDEK